MRGITHFGLALAIAAGIVTNAGASWRGNAGVTAGVIFTDNLYLTADDQESGGIFQLRPYINSTREGNRVQARFSYGPSVLWYPGNAELNRVLHTLGAWSSVELIERYFFLDVAANANQALIDPRVNSDFGAIGNPDAFTPQASITVQPRIQLPVLNGRFATVQITPGVGYNYTAATADGGDGLRTPTSDSSIRITSGPMFTSVPWSVVWRRSVFDTRTNDGFGEFRTTVGYVFGPKYRVDLSVGYDDGTDSYRAANGRTKGTSWETSFLWTPSARAQFRLGVGQRYWGNTGRFDGSYRHKHWAFRSSYSVSVQTASTELQQQQVVPVQDLFGAPIEDPFARGDVLTASVTNAPLVDDTFLQKQFLLASEYSKGRDSAGLQWYLTQRDYDQSDFDTMDNQFVFRYSRRLSGRLTASAVVNFWDHSGDNAAQYDYVQDAVDLIVNYRLGARSNLGARIGRLNRDAQLSTGDFSENRASVNFSWRF